MATSPGEPSLLETNNESAQTTESTTCAYGEQSSQEDADFVSSDQIVLAIQHIQTIRHEKGLDVGSHEPLSKNAADLEAALDVLARQLYTEPRHFLLEFIQNADDNQYASDDLPNIDFKNTPGSLLVTCNEVGVEPKNVEALCRIGQSTKKDRSKGFIGEKGIDFKSVFKIADVVYISSKAYTFKFDTQARLGIIAPVWSSFPVQVQHGKIQFLLSLTEDGQNEVGKQLQKGVRRLESTLLLFLRKSCQISVLFDDSTCTVEGKFAKYICREDYNDQGVTWFASSVIGSVRASWFRIRITQWSNTHSSIGRTRPNLAGINFKLQI